MLLAGTLAKREDVKEQVEQATYIISWVVSTARRNRHCEGASAHGAVELSKDRHVLGHTLRSGLGGIAGMLGGLLAASPSTLTHPASLSRAASGM